MAAMKSSNRYKHIIDLEFFLHRDTKLTKAQRQKRDREIYLHLKKVDGAEVVKEYPPQKLLDYWVQQNSANESPTNDQKSPGSIFMESLGLTKLIVVVLGVTAGLLGGAAFFTYTGKTPVNVFQFLLLFIGAQLALTTIWLLAVLLRNLLPTVQVPSFYWFLFYGSLKRLHSILHKQWLKNISAEKRNGVNHALGIIKSQHSIYGSLFYWPFFCLSQLLGVGFNCGLLATTLLKVATTDLAFGWQSTIQFSDQAVYRMVQIMSTPWHWLSDTVSPTLSEIAGSRIILKDGIYHLATEDLIAWWPFLVLSLFVYGLGLRLALLLLGRGIENYRLKRFLPDTPKHVSLLRRMQTPIVTTQAAPEPRKKEKAPVAIDAKPDEPDSNSELLPQLLLIPDDIFDTCPTAELNSIIKTHGLFAKATYRFQVSYDKDQQLKDSISEHDWQQNTGIFILMEGWMVPLVDFITYLKEIREIVLNKTIITIGLIGRPASTQFTPVKDQDMHMWKQKIESVGDPYIHLISLVTEPEIS